ncbi:MAG: hypothetical protein JNL01_00680 [Bdellovibrionales bacterium]|nr:hypothetical protein [Bdellovibrionales bacterium]
MKLQIWLWISCLLTSANAQAGSLCDDFAALARLTFTAFDTAEVLNQGNVPVTSSKLQVGQKLCNEIAQVNAKTFETQLSDYVPYGILKKRNRNKFVQAWTFWKNAYARSEAACNQKILNPSGDSEAAIQRIAIDTKESQIFTFLYIHDELKKKTCNFQ